MVRRKPRYKGDGYDFTRWFSPRNIFAGSASHQLATNETIFSAVSRLSNTMAFLPLKLLNNFEPVHSQTSDVVVNAPNANMTGFDLRRMLETHRDTHGNGYAMKMYGDRFFQLESLHVLDPNRVTPVIEQKSGELWYEIDGDKGTYYVHNMDMVHVRHIYFGTGYKGISPIDVLRGSIEFDKAYREFTLDTLDSAVKASFILKMETHLSDEQRKKTLENFAQFYQENGGVLIQDAGKTIDPIKREYLDPKVFEAERITIARVARAFNMPVHMLGETEGVNYSTAEQMALEYVQFTIAPIAAHYEAEFNRKLLTPEQRQAGLAFKFNLNALLRGDIKTRGDFYQRGIRNGWFTPNDVRAWEDLPPDPNGNELLVSKDLVPLKNLQGEPGKEVMR